MSKNLLTKDTFIKAQQILGLALLLLGIVSH